MIDLSPLEIRRTYLFGGHCHAAKNNASNRHKPQGYIMCGALDVSLLNDKLKDRNIIAGKAVGVKTIQQLLDAPLESVTMEAETIGIHKG